MRKLGKMYKEMGIFNRKMEAREEKLMEIVYMKSIISEIDTGEEIIKMKSDLEIILYKIHR